jgi:hypothetical protein
MAFVRHQRTSPKALRVPAGVMWQSEAPLNPGRHPQRLTTQAQTTLIFPQKTVQRVQPPWFLAIIQGFAGTARIVIRGHRDSNLGYRHPSWRGEAGAPGPVQICTRPIGTGCLKSIGVSTWHAFAK